MPRIYIVNDGYGNPPKIFNNFYLAEELVFSKIRELSDCGFLHTINTAYVNYKSDYTYEYNGRVKVRSNLKFIEIYKLPVDRGKYREVYVRFPGNDFDILNYALEKHSPSNPGYVFVKDKEVFTHFKWSIRNHGFTYDDSLIEEVTEDWVKDYFSYKFYLSSMPLENKGSNNFITKSFKGD